MTMKNCMGILNIALKHQAQASFAQGGAADVTLHLGLVGAKIRQGEEETRRGCRSRGCSAVFRSGVKSTACSLLMAPARGRWHGRAISRAGRRRP